MPGHLKLFIVLAAFVGLREGELLELRRTDVDGVTGRISVTRKVDKEADRSVRGACPECGRHISTPKTKSGIRVVHVPPPLLPMLQHHLLEFTAEGDKGLLFPGDRTDHMSVRYVMDRYRPARDKAGRPDLKIHHLRHTALTMAGEHGATAELQAPPATHPRQLGDLPARDARPRPAACQEDRPDVRRLAGIAEARVKPMSVPPCRLVCVTVAPIQKPSRGEP